MAGRATVGEAMGEKNENTSAYRRWPRAVAWIIALAVAFRVPMVFQPITYRGDAWRQADTASIARSYATGAFEPFRPQIDWRGAGPGYVETEFPVQPLITSGLYRLVGVHEWLGRFVSLSFSVFALVGVWLLADRLLSRRGATIALAFVALSPMFTRYATAFMPEATMFAFLVWAVYLFDRWLETPTRWLTFGCGAATAMSLLSKPTALHLGVTFAVVLYLRGGWRQLLQKRSVALALIAVAPVGAWLLHARQLHLRYGNTFGVISGGDAKRGDLEMYTSISSYVPTGLRVDSLGIVGIDVVAVLGVFATPVFLIGLWRAGVQRVWVVPVGVVAVYLMYLGAIRYTSQSMGAQYHMHLLLFAALAVGIGATWFFEPEAQTIIARAVGAIALVGFVAVSAVAYVDQFREFRTADIACAARVADVVDEGELVAIVSDSPSVTDQGRFENNYQNPIIFYHAEVKGFSLARDRFTAEGVLQVQAQGASWLVVPEPELVAERDGLAALLRADNDQGSASGCGVYRLTD